MSEEEFDSELFGNKTVDASQSLQQQLSTYQQQLANLPETAAAMERAVVQLDIAETHLALEENESAWNIARDALNVFLENEKWQEAVESYNVLFQAEQPASLSALAQGVWLAVTFPISANTTVAMLQHIVDETPNDSDGAALAAMMAHYIADIRSSEEEHQSLTFLTQNILGKVAKRHSNVNTQAELDAWIQKLELNKPEIFIPRLGAILDIMAEDNWWYDRDTLREKIPNE